MFLTESCFHICRHYFFLLSPYQSEELFFSYLLVQAGALTTAKIATRAWSPLQIAEVLFCGVCEQTPLPTETIK